MDTYEPPIFELSAPGKIGVNLPSLDVPQVELPGELLRGDDMAGMPELSELEVMRHFTRISQRNYCIDTGPYPLGSCSMKGNPKLHEEVARYPGFAGAHPLQDEELSQGALQIMYELQTYLAELSGFDAVSLQPAAGAQGEFTGVLVFRAYHLARGDAQRTEILVPDSAHGTNPATAAMVGMKVVEVKSGPRGNCNIDDLKSKLSPRTAGMMLTNPNTLGLFEENVEEISQLVHAGRRPDVRRRRQLQRHPGHRQAARGRLRPDALQPAQDLHHAPRRRRPGLGPVGCTAELAPFLPGPVVEKVEGPDGTTYRYVTPAQSIGRVKTFWGNFGMLVRAWTYIRTLGAAGLKRGQRDRGAQRQLPASQAPGHLPASLRPAPACTRWC